MLYLADGFRWNGPLVGLGDAGVYILERVLLWGDAFLHGFVVCGTEYAKIERAGVAAYSRHVLQVCFVGTHLFCIYLFDGNVLVVSVAHKAVERGFVMLHGAVLAVLRQ